MTVDVFFLVRFLFLRGFFLWIITSILMGWSVYIGVSMFHGKRGWTYLNQCLLKNKCLSEEIEHQQKINEAFVATLCLLNQTIDKRLLKLSVYHKLGQSHEKDRFIRLSTE
jgi:hypothetical protein